MMHLLAAPSSPLKNPMVGIDATSVHCRALVRSVPVPVTGLLTGMSVSIDSSSSHSYDNGARLCIGSAVVNAQSAAAPRRPADTEPQCTTPSSASGPLPCDTCVCVASSVAYQMRTLSSWCAARLAVTTRILNTGSTRYLFQ